MSREPALKEKAIPHAIGRKRRGGAGSSRDGNPAIPLRVPTLRKLAPDNRAEITVDGARALMCAYILQAVKDVDAKLDYLSGPKNEEMKLHQISAIALIRSPFFARLCGTLSLPTDKIIRKALS